MSDLELVVASWLSDNKCTVIGEAGEDCTSELLKEVAASSKRPRARSNIPLYQRCQAYKANGEQCTRRRRPGADLCGTHTKGIPHGRLCTVPASTPKTSRYLTSVREVNGINYHVDVRTLEVYRTEDILAGTRRPRVIGRLVEAEGGNVIVYTE